MREEKMNKSEIGGRRMSRLRRFSKVAVDNKEVDNKEGDKNKVKKKEADNNRVSEVDTVGRRISRLRRLGTWYSEADLPRLKKTGTNNLIMSLILMLLPVRRSKLCRT